MVPSKTVGGWPQTTSLPFRLARGADCHQRGLIQKSDHGLASLVLWVIGWKSSLTCLVREIIILSMSGFFLTVQPTENTHFVVGYWSAIVFSVNYI